MFVYVFYPAFLPLTFLGYQKPHLGHILPVTALVPVQPQLHLTLYFGRQFLLILASILRAFPYIIDLCRLFCRDKTGFGREIQIGRLHLDRISLT